MMKVIITMVVLLMLGGGFSYGQKVKGTKRATMFYQQFPLDDKLQEHKTYYLSMKGSFTNKNEIEGAVKLPGFEKNEDPSAADIHIEISQFDYSTTGPSLKSKTSTVKNKDGTTSKSTSYWNEKKYKVTHTYYLRLGSGEELVNITVPFSKTFSTNTATSSKGAASTLKKESMGWDRSFNVDAVNEAQETTLDRYCYLNKSSIAALMFFKFKKHDYTELEETAESAILVLKENKDPTEENVAAIKGFIDIWTKELANYEEGNKKARINDKIKIGILYNIGYSSIYIDDYVNASIAFQEAEALGKRVNIPQKTFTEISKRNSEIIQAKN